jgi:hypothetical protein
MDETILAMSYLAAREHVGIIRLESARGLFAQLARIVHV